jgi:hypothetical protein
MPEKRITPSAINGTQGGIRMWPSEYWASRLYDLANLFLIAALIVGVVSTGLVVWMGNIKEGYLRRDLAIANGHAAEAIQKAEAEHLARVRIEEKLAGWKLGAEGQAKIIERLKKYAKTPFDLGANPTEMVFMETMDGILNAAGWTRQNPKPGPDPLRWTVYRLRFLTSSSSIFHSKRSLPPQAAEALG